MNYSPDQLFNLALSQKASDVHIAVGVPPVFRIDGNLVTQSSMAPVTPEEAAAFCYGLLNNIQKQVFDEKRELDLGYSLSNGARARINMHWERGFAGLVARIIPAKIPTLEELMMGDIFKELLHNRQGLILLTGPSGAGKTTSLAAMIEHINQGRTEHIVTLEDPIEFIYASKRSLIRQRELDSDMLSFAEALKHVIRQDPNVIVVGEMRDWETIAATITLAETGHLILASLHTINAEQAINRAIDVFPPHQQDQVRMQLALVLKAVIAKQLVPRASGGRIPFYEILLNNPAVSNTIRENKLNQLRSIMQTSRRLGMVTIEQEIERLRKAGEITLETAQTHFAGLNPR